MLAPSAGGSGTSSQGNNFSVFIDCSSNGELEKLFTALSQDGKVTMPPSDMPFGCFGMCDDSFGISWILTGRRPAEHGWRAKPGRRNDGLSTVRWCARHRGNDRRAGAGGSHQAQLARCVYSLLSARCRPLANEGAVNSESAQPVADIVQCGLVFVTRCG